LAILVISYIAGADSWHMISLPLLGMFAYYLVFWE
jgi:hypothetical protein